MPVTHVKVDEVHHGANPHPVNHVADRAAKNLREPERDPACVSRQTPQPVGR